MGATQVHREDEMRAHMRRRGRETENGFATDEKCVKCFRQMLLCRHGVKSQLASSHAPESRCSSEKFFPPERPRPSHARPNAAMLGLKSPAVSKSKKKTAHPNYPILHLVHCSPCFVTFVCLLFLLPPSVTSAGIWRQETRRETEITGGGER